MKDIVSMDHMNTNADISQDSIVAGRPQRPLRIKEQISIYSSWFSYPPFASRFQERKPVAYTYDWMRPKPRSWRSAKKPSNSTRQCKRTFALQTIMKIYLRMVFCVVHLLLQGTEGRKTRNKSSLEAGQTKSRTVMVAMATRAHPHVNFST